MNRQIRLTLMALAAVLFFPPLTVTTQAADHGDPPLFPLFDPFPVLGENGASNIGDFYAFRNPNDESQLVFVVTFSPIIPAGTTVVAFDEDIVYTINVDNQVPEEAEDIRSRIAIKASFKNGGVKVDGDGAEITAVFAGLVDDPFLQNDNGFGLDVDLNINALVIQVSLDSIVDGDNPLLFWANTKTKGFKKKFQDSAGNPNTNALLVGVDIDKFNQTRPRDHVKKFGPQAEGLLPDVLSFDPALPDGFPNGRLLTDELVPKADFTPNTIPDLEIPDHFPFVNGPN